MDYGRGFDCAACAVGEDQCFTSVFVLGRGIFLALECFFDGWRFDCDVLNVGGLRRSLRRWVWLDGLCFFLLC